MPPRSSPASRASPACAIRCWCRTNRATSARARSAPTKSRCSPPPRKPSTARTSTPRSTNRSSASRRCWNARSADGVRVRGYVSTVLGCPYQGEVPVGRRGARRASACTRWAATRSRSATPSASARRARRARCCARSPREVPMPALAVHFHDTYGQALSNILACLEEGVRVVDSVGVRHRRLPVREGRQRQRRQRGRGLHAARPGHRHRHRPRPAGRHRTLARRPARPRHRQQGRQGARGA